MKISYEELLHRALNAIKGAMGCGRASCLNIDEARFNFAAARTWINRAEYSLDRELELSESDFGTADRVQFERLLGDYGNHRQGAKIVIEDFSGTICAPICSVADCGQPAVWQDSLHGEPCGKKWCGAHAIQNRNAGEVIPFP